MDKMKLSDEIKVTIKEMNLSDYIDQALKEELEELLPKAESFENELEKAKADKTELIEALEKLIEINNKKINILAENKLLYAVLDLLNEIEIEQLLSKYSEKPEKI